MTIMLVFLMAFQVTGDKYHEWIGAGMLVLFLTHNILNYKWYKNIFKGKYSAIRVFNLLVNICTLVSILMTGYSGIVMSRYVFAFLPVKSGLIVARKMHLAGSYWAFVFMGIHLGIHWSMVTSRLKYQSKLMSEFIRFIGFVIAIAGAYFFVNSEIIKNMLLQNEFAFLDYETPGIFIILENLAMMSTCILVGHYISKLIRKLSK